MNIFRSVWRKILLLQLENYHLGRFRQLAAKREAYTDSTRQRIKWTAKLILVAGLAKLIILAMAGLVAVVIHLIVPSGYPAIVVFVGVFLAAVSIFEYFLAAAVIILLPLDRYIKQRWIVRARAKIKSLPNLKIVAVAGSYGKTTTKEVVATILREKFQVVVTPGTENTPLGIARLIKREVDSQTEVLVIEMGEHEPGDIRDLCQIAPPHLSVLMGINEAHLERMGSLANATAALFEIVTYARPETMVFLNADSPLIAQHAKEYCGQHETIWFSAQGHSRARFQIKQPEFRADGSGWRFEFWEDKRKIGSYQVPILGEYILGTVMAAVAIAQKLGLTDSEITRGVSQIKPVAHRLQLISGHRDILVIDDSYNGNPDGVREAIRVLVHFPDRRKVFFTPGLLETGERTREIHLRIGQELALVADLVILIRNSVTPHLAEGLRAKNFLESNIIWFDNTLAAHAALANILKPRDVILFQNDWPEDYL
ncbi:MAG: UDP-N-acetylmuramoyl-tripeptide--D-alanyl-D-alanine ligase [Candidatus Liptonbacteria bacterium]|nr:UDP-N-acetylmuramoyl-tripeptide--D-alanyl-D-alanine ligase [Candidatus Liptonbacteria bacterium]